MRKVLLIGGVGAAVGLLVLVAGCSGGSRTRPLRPSIRRRRTCPHEWKAGWQQLANEIEAPVYCPSWLPRPLDGRFDGVFNGQTVDPDRSYLIKFLWFEPGLPGGTQEVHVNFRGLAGQPANTGVRQLDG